MFADPRAARLASHDDHLAARSQGVNEQLELRALAATVDAFKCYQSSAHIFGIWIIVRSPAFIRRKFV